MLAPVYDIQYYLVLEICIPICSISPPVTLIMYYSLNILCLDLPMTLELCRL